MERKELQVASYNYSAGTDLRGAAAGKAATRRALLRTAGRGLAGIAATGLLAACGTAATATTASTVTATVTAAPVTVTGAAVTVTGAAVTVATTVTAAPVTVATTVTAAAATVKAGATSVTVLDAWGTGPWTNDLYFGWTQGLDQALPDVKVEFIMTGDFKGGSDAKTLAMIAAGTPPDLTLGSDIGFAIKDAIVDLKPYFDRDKEIGAWQWYPPCWQYANIVLDSGHPMLWAFPGNSDARVIYLNLDLLQKAGISYDPSKPWDWTAFEEHARALTKRPSNGVIEQLGFSGLWNLGDPYVLAQYAGGDFFHYDAQSGWVDKATFSSAGAQTGLSFYRKLMVEDKVGQLPDEKFAGSFTSGQVAMTPSWTSFLSALTPKTNPKLATFKWDVMGYPVQHAGEKWPNQFANGSQMGSLVKGTKHLTEAFQVGKYFIGDGHVVRMEAMGAPPIVINNAKQQDVWKQRAPGTHYTEVYSAVMAKGSIGLWAKIKLNWDKISTLYGDNITKLLQGQMAVSDFGATMDSSVNPLLQQS